MNFTILAIVLHIQLSCTNDVEYSPVKKVGQNSNPNNDNLSKSDKKDGNEALDGQDEVDKTGENDVSSDNDEAEPPEDKADEMNEDQDTNPPAGEDPPEDDDEKEDDNEEMKDDVEIISTYFVYVAANDRIIHYELDQNNGSLTERSQFLLNNNPGNRDISLQIAIGKNNQFMYVGLENNEGGDKTNIIQSLSIKPDDGTLSLVASQNLDFRPVYLHVDNSGKSLIVSSYFNNKVEVFPILANGQISYDEANRRELLTGEKAHSVITSPGNDFIIFPNTGDGDPEIEDPGTSRIQGADFDPVNMTISNRRNLTPLNKAGPRHIRFHPTLPIFYAVNEYADSVSWYSWDGVNKSLTLVDSILTLPESSRDFTCADLHLSSDGRFLYASNRDNTGGVENDNKNHSIAMFSVDTTTGALSQIQGERVATVGRPREFVVDPLDNYLFVLGQNPYDGDIYRIQSYSIDKTTGALSSLQTYELGTSPTWIEVVTFTKEVPKAE